MCWTHGFVSLLDPWIVQGFGTGRISSAVILLPFVYPWRVYHVLLISPLSMFFLWSHAWSVCFELSLTWSLNLTQFLSLRISCSLSPLRLILPPPISPPLYQFTHKLLNHQATIPKPTPLPFHAKFFASTIAIPLIFSNYTCSTFLPHPHSSWFLTAVQLNHVSQTLPSDPFPTKFYDI